MYRSVYIVGDLVVDFTEDEYIASFTDDQIADLEAGGSIEWIDEDGIDHIVRLILN